MFSIQWRVCRQNLSLILIGLAFSSLGYYLLLRSQFIDRGTREPSPPSGLTYSINSRGSVYFLSPVQTTELGLLKYAFAISFTAGVLLTTQALQLARFVLIALEFVASGAWNIGTREAAQSTKNDRSDPGGSAIYFFGSILTSLVIIWFSIFHVASMLVLKGAVLGP
jgi:hypothetical protein